MIKLQSHRFLFGCFALFLMAQAGCHSIHPSGHPLACDSLPAPCDNCDVGCCDAMPCDCDGGCDVCCDGYSDDACDAYRGIGSNQIVRGRQNRFLDGTGSVFGCINKLALWDRRADSHNISPATERKIANYLRRNRLDSVLVRSNQYDPFGEWGRLVANKRMAPGWKYSIGTYEWLKYTIIPGRLFGGDQYNPFSDTVYLYSDIPSIGLAKAAYAKDVHGHTYQGTYATGQSVPLVGLWHESLANKEVMRYLGRSGSQADIREANRILVPDFGGAIGSHLFGFLPYGSVYGRAAGALTGHAYRGVTESDFMQQASRSSDSQLR